MGTRHLPLLAGILLLIDLASKVLCDEITPEDSKDSTTPTTSGAITHLEIGARVVRGKDWDWDNQDGGVGGVGTVIEGMSDGWVKVKWDTGSVHRYRTGWSGKYDIQLVTAGSNDSTTPAASDIASLMKIGARVVRGKDWNWENEDGGVGGVGTVIEEVSDGWVKVKWDTGSIHKYRMGESGKYELQLVTADSNVSTASATSDPAPLLKIGARVVRGKDWDWDNQDGGVGGVGTVIEEVSDGWVKVKWDTGSVHKYRMGWLEKYDLQLVTTAGSNDSTTPGTPDPASLLKIGARVIRGKDWEWENQDGGKGRFGVVVRGVLDGWVRVQWDAGELNSYRMGFAGKYDLDLTEPITSTEPAVVSSTMSGPELARRMVMGVRVVRGKDWNYGDQDGGKGRFGVVVRGVLDGWVRVQWDAGEQNSYRMGFAGKYDLDLAEPITSTEPAVDSSSSASSNSPTDSDLVSRMIIGTRVVRGKDWKWGDEDGGIGGLGTVIKEVTDGWVDVQWDSGDGNTYRMGHDGKYDLDLAPSIANITSSTPSVVTTTLATKNTGSPNFDPAIDFKYGTRVIRGRDWEWENQDGGPGSVGTIIEEVSNGWVKVKWDAGGVHRYRMGWLEKFDLELADGGNASCTVSIQDFQDLSQVGRLVQQEFNKISDANMTQAMQDLTTVLQKYSEWC